ncbi:MAG: hypothetical protein D6701_00170, partial [Gemmatimonadetes bacterium]
IGETVTGSLAASDPRYGENPVQVWTLHGEAGAPFTVDLVSADFDAFLWVMGAEPEDILEDDDGAGCLNSRVSGTLPAGGRARIVVSPLDGATGDYEVRVTAEPGPMVDCDAMGGGDGGDGAGDGGGDDHPLAAIGRAEVEGALPPGGSVTDALSSDDVRLEDTTVDVWTFTVAETAATVRFDLESSAIDPFLFLWGPGFEDGIGDDDSGEGMNARLCVSLPPGTYRLVVGAVGQRTFAEDAPAAYRLWASEVGEDESGCERIDMSRAERMMRYFRMPVRGELAIGERAEDRIDVGDPTDPDNEAPLHVWAIDLEAGQSVTLDLRSRAFDAFLRVVGPGMVNALSDDDGAGACDARITLEASEAGRYLALVQSTNGDRVGPYSLEALETAPFDGDAYGCSPSALDLAEPMRRPLDDLAGVPEAGPDRALDFGWEQEALLTAFDARRASGAPAQVWSLTLEEGQRVAVEANGVGFDPVLFVTGPGLDAALYDDDGAGGVGSRIAFTAPADGTYRVVVSATTSEAEGSYRVVALRRR